MTTSYLEKSDKIYLDHNATTPLSAEVAAAIPTFLNNWGNPSSIHWAGRMPKNIIRDTRAKLAAAFHVSPLEIVFTSGGSESNSSVLRSVFEGNEAIGKQSFFIASQVEHPSVIKTLEYLKARGARVELVRVNREGEFDMAQYQELLSQGPSLVSVMYANNETGVIFPIRKICDLAHKAGALFHTDAVQTLGKVPLNLAALDVDFASFSGHKFYSLKGCGFLYIKRNSKFTPLIFGGGQERFRRGGTENTIGIFSLGVMADYLPKVLESNQPVTELRNWMEQKIIQEIPGVKITSQNAKRLPNTSSLVIDNVDGETLLMSLDIKGFAVSTGAACSSGSPEPSPVLLAIGLSRQEAQSSLRLSLGWGSTRQQVEQFVATLVSVVSRLRALPRDVKENEASL